MEYLTRWRMLLARDRLANSSDPISVIALSLGYESESAFSTASKSFSPTPHRIIRGDTCFALLKVRIGHIHPEM
jgi:AraC-like DNA-binding protein